MLHYAIQDNIDGIEEPLNNPNVSKIQKEELHATKDAAEELLDEIKTNSEVLKNAKNLFLQLTPIT